MRTRKKNKNRNGRYSIVNGRDVAAMSYRSPLSWP
jgi:hypothetical protein